MKKLLIIQLLIVGFIFMKPFNTEKEFTLDYCKEFCGYDNGKIPCGNCWADCMELND